MHGELLALALHPLVLVQAVEDLLLRLVADGAGVVQDQARVGLVLTLRRSPRCSSVPTTFSESWAFIWQPKVSI